MTTCLSRIVAGFAAILVASLAVTQAAHAAEWKFAIEEIAGSAAASIRLPPAHIRADQTPKQ